MTEPKKRTPGVPNDALLKAFGATECDSKVDWAIDDRKTVTLLKLGAWVYQAPTNTALITLMADEIYRLRSELEKRNAS
jgi:hypothetical protein